VWLGGVNINKWLLKNRLAVEYDGGTKNAEIKWGEFQNGNGKNAVNYEKLVRTSTKDYSGKKRIKKERKLDGGGKNRPVNKKKNDVAKVKNKNKESARKSKKGKVSANEE